MIKIKVFAFNRMHPRHLLSMVALSLLGLLAGFASLAATDGISNRSIHRLLPVPVDGASSWVSMVCSTYRYMLRAEERREREQEKKETDLSSQPVSKFPPLLLHLFV
jgi:hypothetical protein